MIDNLCRSETNNDKSKYIITSLIDSGIETCDIIRKLFFVESYEVYVHKGITTNFTTNGYTEHSTEIVLSFKDEITINELVKLIEESEYVFINLSEPLQFNRQMSLFGNFRLGVFPNL